MEDSKLKNFLGVKETPANVNTNVNNRVLTEHNGLLERIDRKVVTSEGKQLLKEVIHES